MIKNFSVLPDKEISKLIKNQEILSQERIVPEQIQPASLDLRLGAFALQIRSSFLPGKNVSVWEKAAHLSLNTIDLHGATLVPGCIYIAPLLERLELPPHVSAIASPKSSTGRLDVFTRLIVNGACEFDKVPAGYNGPLYLEISPRTFPIVVCRGSELAQIRFYDERVEKNVGLTPLELSVVPIGYRAKPCTPPIHIDFVEEYDAKKFWDKLDDVILSPDRFYIFSSYEELYIPPSFSAYLAPITPSLGEFRLHSAGFFDPGFIGKAVLEMRSYGLPFQLEHKQPIGYLIYENMVEEPDVLYGDKNYYQDQSLKLAKQFKANTQS